MGTIAYAKYDKDFRKKIEEYAPWTANFFKVVFQEDDESLSDFFSRKYNEFSNLLNDTINEGSKKIKDTAKEIESGYTGTEKKKKE